MEQSNTQQIIDKLSAVNTPNNFAPANNNFAPAKKEFDDQHRRKVITVWKYVGKFFLLIWTILCLARVPFIGSYVDGLFDYVTGLGKYILYALIIFVLIGWIFNTAYTRVVKSKRFVLFSLLALLSACCIISGVTGIIDSFAKPLPFNEIMANYHNAWLPYFTNWHYSGFFNFYITGGILAELISYVFAFLSFIVLIIIAFIILLICIFIIFNINYKSTRIGLRIRAWMVRKLGGTFRYDGYNELKADKDNQNKFKKAKKTDVENVALTTSSIPFTLLPESDLNKFDANFKHARQIHNKLATLFRDSNIDCVPTDINVFTSYTEVCFEAKSKTEIKKIIDLQPLIAKIAKLDHFNMSLRGNIVNIELENLFFSKFSLKTVFNLYTEGKDLTAVIGLDKNSELCTHNFRNNGSALIVGQKGSGSATLAVLMALSTCYITHPDNLELVILNPNAESTYAAFNNLPHINGRFYETINTCTDKLHDLQNIVNERNSLLKVNDVKNIDQLNKISNNTTKYKHILVIIANVDSIVKETFQNNTIIGDILVNGPKVGVYLVMQAYTMTNDLIDKVIYNNVCDKYIMGLSTKTESIKIFNNHRGYQLHGNGDCLHFVNDKISAMKRIQICNLNYAELATDVEIIKTFYTSKQRQKEAELLTEAKNE